MRSKCSAHKKLCIILCHLLDILFASCFVFQCAQHFLDFLFCPTFFSLRHVKQRNHLCVKKMKNSNMLDFKFSFYMLGFIQKDTSFQQLYMLSYLALLGHFDKEPLLITLQKSLCGKIQVYFQVNFTITIHFKCMINMACAI